MKFIRFPPIGLGIASLMLALAPGVAAPSSWRRPGGAQPGYDSLGADWGAQQDDARAGVRQGRYVTLARVIAEIRRRTPGEQLDAGLEQAAGRAVYRVRWAATNGRRIDYIVDASNGAILSVDGR